MTMPAGWYPDPQAPGQMRYWDGQAWTQQTAPAQPDAQQPQEAGAPGFDQGHPGAPGYAPGQPGGPGQPGPEQAGFAQGHPGAPGYAPGQPGGPGQPEQQKKSPAVWIVSGIAALLVALIVVVIVLLAGSGDDSDEEDTGAAEDESGEEAVTEDEDDEEEAVEDEDEDPEEDDEEDLDQPDALEIDEALTIDLAEDDEVTLDMQVEESGIYTVDLSGDTGTEPTLEIHDSLGLVDEVDSEGAEVFLLPDDYELILTEDDGEETSVDLEIALDEVIEAEEIEAGDHDFSFDDDGHYVAVVDVEDGAEVTIDVRADDEDDDAVLNVVLPDGTTEYNDDRGGDDPDSGNHWDPYLEFEVDEGGTMVILITGFAGDSVEGEMSLEID